MASYHAVRSVVKALDLLVLINHRNGASIHDLSKATGIPKATVVRLMRTLIGAGFAIQHSERGNYYATSRLFRVFGGFWAASLLVEAVRPHAARLTRQFKWPISVAVLDCDAMIIADSTMRESPISWTPPAADRRLPILTAGHGKAFFAFCSPEQQRIVLDTLCRSRQPENVLAKRPAELAAMLEEVRRNGFADRDLATEPLHQNTIAVPLLARGDAIGSLGITYFRRAVSRDEALARYVRPLRRAAESIGRYLDGLETDSRSVLGALPKPRLAGRRPPKGAVSAPPETAGRDP